MSQPVLSTPAAPVPPSAAVAAAPAVQLVRLPVDKPQAAVAFLRAHSRGVMDLIAHFWEGLAQTGPLQRGDFHLVAVAGKDWTNANINMSTLDAMRLAGAMLYVPKAHRADVLALSSDAAAALAGYICHLGQRALPAPVASETSDNAVEWGQPILTLNLTDLTGRVPTVETIPAELICRPVGVGGGNNGTGSNNGMGSGANSTNGNGMGIGGGGAIPIDFLTGEATAIAWMTPLLLPLVHKRHPAREMTNFVMQLPDDVPCGLHPQVRPARESDIPALNRWRRLYKEERSIHFDADMDALVHNQRVFVYELPAETPAPASPVASESGAALAPAAGGDVNGGAVAAVAKIDLDLANLMEIGGVYTFPEHRKHGYSAALMGDMARRIRQAGKRPTLQVDEANLPALRLYEKLGWQSMGKLARVWLTG